MIDLLISATVRAAGLSSSAGETGKIGESAALMYPLEARTVKFSTRIGADGIDSTGECTNHVQHERTNSERFCLFSTAFILQAFSSFVGTRNFIIALFMWPQYAQRGYEINHNSWAQSF